MLPYESSVLYNRDNLTQECPWNPDAWPKIPGTAYWEWIIPAAAVFYSREWQHMLQSSNDGILGPSNAIWWPLIHNDDLVPFMDAARDIAEQRSDQYQSLFRIQRADGAWIWMLSRGGITEKREGVPFRITGIISDVSPLRSDLKFLHGAQPMEQENALLANSPDLIIRMDRQLSPLFNNPQIVRYLTRSVGLNQFAEQQAPFGISQEQLIFLRDNVNWVFDTGLSVRQVITFPTAYGHDVSGEYSFWPEFDQQGNVLSVLTQFRDLTEQIIAESRARLNEMRLEALYQLTQMDSAPREQVNNFVMDSLIDLTGSESGVLFFPSDNKNSGQVVWSKDLHARIAQDSLPQTALPAGLFEFLLGKENGIQRRLANGNGLFPLYRSPDGALNIMRFISAPVFDRDHLVCIAAVINKEPLYYEADLQQLEAFISGAWHILRRHMFVQQLQMAKEAAEEANRTKAQFFANVNHELRTPLASILGYAETIITLGTEQEEFRSISLKAIHRNAVQMHKLVEDLLILSRADSDLPLNVSLVSLKEIACNVAQSMQPQTLAKNLRIRNTISVKLRVRADARVLYQVFRNLLENACRYAKVDTDILISACKKGNEAVVSVQDRGIGIEPADLSRIFERFYCGKQAEGMKKSTGLGLAICKHAIERHGGRIWAENTPPGATLRFTLPLAPNGPEVEL